MFRCDLTNWISTLLDKITTYIKQCCSLEVLPTIYYHCHLFVFVMCCQLLIYGWFFHPNLEMEDSLLCDTNYFTILIITTIILLSNNRPSDLLRFPAISLEVSLLTIFLWGHRKAFVLVILYFVDRASRYSSC